MKFDKEKFIKDYKILKSSRKMSELYKCDRKLILKYAKEIGFVNNYYRDLSDEEIKYITDNYYTKTSTQLSNELGVSQSLIKKIWKENCLKGKTSYVYPFNYDYFKSIDTKDKAYFLGLIASDGCSYEKDKIKYPNNQKILSITLQEEDRYILDTFKKYIESEKPLAYYTKKENSTDLRKYCNIQLVSDKTCKDLEQYNIFPRKTYIFTTPKLRNDLYSHYIRGYFDGDGSINIKKDDLNTPSKYNVAITGFFDNIKIIQDILLKNNIVFNFFQDNRGKYEEKIFGEIRNTNIESTYNFLKYIYNDCDDLYIPRKKYLSDCFFTSVKNNYSNKTNLYENNIIMPSYKSL